jgi:Histidine kinase-, DNA gyrase B-, and HSP90-like ATPase
MKTTKFGDAAEETFAHETVTMTIAEEGMEHLMGTLTNLYTIPAPAVLREYSANALDSHTRAGTKRPIEITLPSRAYPNLVIQDFGTGLDKEGLTNYSQYGTSSKRKSNAEIGAFGLGCKSALALADEFFLTSVKDGVKFEAKIAKNSRGVGVLHFLSETPTNDANGLTVSIPALSYISELIKAVDIDKFFFTFPQGSVLVNGKEPKNVWNSDFLRLESAGQIIGWVKAKDQSRYGLISNITTAVHQISSAVRFIVGGINYDISWFDTTLAPRLAHGSEVATKFMKLVVGIPELYLTLPIGSVSLTPSRDKLLVDAKTLGSISDAIEGFIDAAPAYLSSYIQSLPLEEAYELTANHWTLMTGGYSVNNKTFDRAPTPYELLTYPGAPSVPEVSWRGQNVPYSIPTTGEIWGFEVINGTNVQKEPSRLVDWQPIRAVAHQRVELDPKNYYFYERKNSAIFVVKEDFNKDDEATLKTIRNNAKDFMNGLPSVKAATIVFSQVAPTDAWVLAGWLVVSYADYIAGAREHRKAKREANMTNSPARSKASYYSVEVNSHNRIINKTPVDDFSGELVYIEQDEVPNGSFEAWQVLKNAATFKDFSGANAKISATLRSRLNILIPNTTLIFLTTGKKGSTLVKRYPSARNLKTVLLDKLTGLAENPETAKLSAALFGAEKTLFVNHVANFVKETGGIYNIDDKFTAEVFNNLSDDSELAELVRFANTVRPFIVGSPIHTSLEKISERFPLNYEVKYTLLSHAKSPMSRHKDDLEYTQQIVGFINMADKMYSM